MSDAEAVPSGTSWRNLRTLTHAAWRLDPRRLLVQVVLLLVTGVLGGASLVLLIPIVNSVATGSEPIDIPGLGAVNLAGLPLPALLAAFVALSAAQAFVSRTSSINSTVLQQEIVDRMRQQAFDAILAARWSFVLARRRSDIIEVVTTGANRCGIAFQQLLMFSVTAILALVTAAVALAIAPLVATVSIVGVAILGVALATSFGPSHRMGALYGRRNRRLQSVMIDSMDSLRLVRAHGASRIWAEQLGEAFGSTRETQIANTRRNATVSAVSSVGLAVCASLLVLVSVWAAVPATTIVVILALVARLARNVQTMAQNGSLLANALPAVGDLVGLTQDALADEEFPAGAEASARRLPALAAGSPLVEFRGVTYTYPGSTNGVQGLDFTVAAGDITVLTGPSGAGKSTCADLALGLLSPDSGEVRVAGRPLAAADLPWWRDHVAYVPQETVLIPGTLRENLVWSVPGDVTEARCWEALDQAAAGFARRLPDGLDTLLGDRGVRLSGGERQRVAIARALLRDPALLVLDEATSALDDDTEAAVIGLVDSLVPALTVLVIAHRRSTVESAHHVVRLADGRVQSREVDVRRRADVVAG